MTREEEIKYASKDYVNYLLDKQEYHNENYTEYDIQQAFEKGAQWADNNPKSPWIRVENDLPCNHKELIDKEKNMTKRVLIIGKDGKSNITPNIMSMFFIENCWQWACEIYFKVTYWMPIPKLPKE